MPHIKISKQLEEYPGAMDSIKAFGFALSNRAELPNDVAQYDISGPGIEPHFAECMLLFTNNVHGKLESVTVKQMIEFKQYGE